jgi:hypothetical protein
MQVVIGRSDDSDCLQRFCRVLAVLGLHKTDEYTASLTAVEHYQGQGRFVKVLSHGGVVEILGTPGIVMSILAHLNSTT